MNFRENKFVVRRKEPVNVKTRVVCHQDGRAIGRLHSGQRREQEIRLQANHAGCPHEWTICLAKRQIPSLF